MNLSTSYLVLKSWARTENKKKSFQVICKPVVKHTKQNHWSYEKLLTVKMGILASLTQAMQVRGMMEDSANSVNPLALWDIGLERWPSS